MKLKDLTEHQKEVLTGILLACEAYGTHDVWKGLKDDAENTYDPNDERDHEFLAHTLTAIDLIDNLDPPIDILVNVVSDTVRRNIVDCPEKFV